MSKIKSLADQLRERIADPKITVEPEHYRKKKATVPLESKPVPINTEIISLIMAYDCSANRTMIHVKLDPSTAKLLSHFKMATGIDNIKLVAFAVKYLFDTTPELKSVIKQYTQNLEL